MASPSSLNFFQPVRFYQSGFPFLPSTGKIPPLRVNFPLHNLFSILVSMTGPVSWTWLYVRGLTKQSALATMEHSLWLRLLGTSLGLRPPTRPASMGGETPGNNYPGYFSCKNMHLSPCWPSSSRTLNLSRAHHMDAKCESYLRNFV